MIRLVTAVAICCMLLSSPSIAVVKAPDAAYRQPYQTNSETETIKTDHATPTPLTSSEPDQQAANQAKNSKPQDKSDWSAAKIVGTVIAIPLIPVMLAFELLTDTAKKMPESTPLFAGDIVRGIADK